MTWADLANIETVSLILILSLSFLIGPRIRLVLGRRNGVTLGIFLHFANGYGPITLLTDMETFTKDALVFSSVGLAIVVIAFLLYHLVRRKE
jgi:hypothetical protein